MKSEQCLQLLLAWTFAVPDSVPCVITALMVTVPVAGRLAAGMVRSLPDALLRSTWSLLHTTCWQCGGNAVAQDWQHKP
jgi:hypothetical protein